MDSILSWWSNKDLGWSIIMTQSGGDAGLWYLVKVISCLSRKSKKKHVVWLLHDSSLWNYHNIPHIILLSQSLQCEVQPNNLLRGKYEFKKQWLMLTRSQQTHMYHLCSTCLNDYPPFHVQNNSSRSPSWQPWKTGLLDKSTKIQVPQRHQKWIPFTSFYIKIKIKSIKKIPSGLNSVFFKRSTVGPRSLVLFLY